jgi:hypothetical protein
MPYLQHLQATDMARHEVEWVNNPINILAICKKENKNKNNYFFSVLLP